MKNIKPVNQFNFSGEVDGDKSITHRAILFLSVANRAAVIRNALISLDTLASIDCMQKLGAKIERAGNDIRIEPIRKAVSGVRLNAENSGTTIRLLAGMISSLGIEAELDGDASLRRRPMMRVIEPLRSLGAEIESSGGYAPLKIHAKRLHGGRVDIASPSAQVKSAVILAALNADVPSEIHVPLVTRDHTERMLIGMGAEVDASKSTVITVKPSRLTAKDIDICGDISSAAYLLALGALKGRACIANVGINPTRAGILQVLDQMGASVRITRRREICGEEVADLEIEKSSLKPIEIGGDMIANVIDELPIIAVLMAYANGRSAVKNAEELRIKESDRIRLITENLRGAGVKIEERTDGFVIYGKPDQTGNENYTAITKGDHRIAMSMCVFGLASGAGLSIDDENCIDVSFPSFREKVGI